jgi:hypothetical protein
LGRGEHQPSADTKLRIVVLNDGHPFPLCGGNSGGRNLNKDGDSKATAATG